MKRYIFALLATLCLTGQAWAKTDITSQHLTNAGLTSLSGWDYGDNGYNYTDWKTDGDVPVIEFYHTWSDKPGTAIGSTRQFHFAQAVTLPAGYYRLAVNAFYREGDGNGTNTKAYIFAGDKQQYITGLPSNGLSAYSGSKDIYKAANAFAKGDFSNEFDFHLASEQTITIGFRGYIDTYCSWCILGPVTLYEYTAEEMEQEAHKAARRGMLEALERFENDYNLADGTDYRRLTMSAEAWTSLLDKVNAVSTALGDASLAGEYAARRDALIEQMDATDASLHLFNSYKAMSNGVNSIVGGTAADSDTDSDAAEQAAIDALNTAFDDYAATQTAAFSAAAFLGTNLDFSAAHGEALNTDNSNAIYGIEGWEVTYDDAESWTVLQNQHSEHLGELYMRKNWGSDATTLTVAKRAMLPVGKYRLSLSWNSSMANMDNLSAYTLGETVTAIGEATTAAKTLNYDFEVTDAATPFDLTIGFKRKNSGNAPAQIIADNVALQCLPTVIALSDSESNEGTLSANNGKRGAVTLKDRVLYKDGAWNTLCLPFDMTATQVTEQLAPAALMTLSTAHFSEGTLTLTFAEATAIEAGKPYIIKWNQAGNLHEPTFTGVTIKNLTADIETANVDFKGCFSPFALTANDNTVLYLSNSNTLYWPGTDATMGACRAYFQLKGISAGNVAATRLIFGSEEVTGIAEAESKRAGTDALYFDLQGRRVTTPARGLYIVRSAKGNKKQIKTQVNP